MEVVQNPETFPESLASPVSVSLPISLCQDVVTAYFSSPGVISSSSFRKLATDVGENYNQCLTHEVFRAG